MLRYGYLLLFIPRLSILRFWSGRSPGSLQEFCTKAVLWQFYYTYLKLFSGILPGILCSSELTNCRIDFGKGRARLCSADQSLNLQKGSYWQMCSNPPSFFITVCNPTAQSVCVLACLLSPQVALWSPCVCVCQSLPDISAWLCCSALVKWERAQPEWLQASHCEVWWR